MDGWIDCWVADGLTGRQAGCIDGRGERCMVQRVDG